MTTGSTGALSSARIVVVGASLGGLRTAEALRDLGFSGAITVVGDEPHPPYERPPLSKTLIAGTTTPEEAALPQPADLGAEWQLGRRAAHLDLDRRTVTLDNGSALGYDGLVVATGARPRIPRDWADVSGVHVLRGLEDAVALRSALRNRPRRVAVLGAGFIGSEVAASIRGLGLAVTLIDGAALPLEQAVGSHVARFIADQHRDHGVDLQTGTTVRGLEVAEGTLTGLRLSDGSHLDADLAVVGFGVTANTDWLQGSGLVLDDGVLCDASLTAHSDAGPTPRVVAAGDVARWPHPLAGGEAVRVEHWSNAVEHGRAAARTLLHRLTGASGTPPVCDAVPSFWTDQYHTKLLAIGLPGISDTSAILDGSFDDGRVVVGYGRQGRLVGAVAINHPRGLVYYRRLLTDGAPWPPTPPPDVPPAQFCSISSRSGRLTGRTKETR